MSSTTNRIFWARLARLAHLARLNSTSYHKTAPLCWRANSSLSHNCTLSDVEREVSKKIQKLKSAKKTLNDVKNDIEDTEDDIKDVISKLEGLQAKPAIPDWFHQRKQQRLQKEQQEQNKDREKNETSRPSRIVCWTMVGMSIGWYLHIKYTQPVPELSPDERKARDKYYRDKAKRYAQIQVEFGERFPDAETPRGIWEEHDWEVEMEREREEARRAEAEAKLKARQEEELNNACMECLAYGVVFTSVGALLIGKYAT